MKVKKHLKLLKFKESQEKEIGELKITLNLKETNTEDEVDKIEEKLDFMKIYARQ